MYTPRRMRRDEILVTPEGWLSRGDAFVSGQHSQLTIFGGIPGELAKVGIFDRVAHQARGRWLGSERPSPERVAVPCQHYGRCGGCPWMHLSAAGQARAHRWLIVEALRAAQVDVPVAPIVVSAGADVVHSLELVAGWSDQRHFRLGMAAREGRGIVPVPDCLKVTSTLRGLMTVATWEFSEAQVRPFDGRSGALKGLFAWQSPQGEVLVVIDVAKSFPVFGEIADRLAERIPAIRGVLARMPEGHTKRLYGDQQLDVEMNGLRLRLGADEVPVNPVAAERMLADLPEQLGIAEGDAVIDVGAGVGVRTCALGRGSGWAFGLEADPALVLRARENAARNNVTAEFVPGSPVAELTDARARFAGRRPLVHVDLGRKSLDDELRAALRALDPRRVAFTAVNPVALAMELARWVGTGWTPLGVTPYDIAVHGPLGAAVAVVASPDASAPSLRAPRRRKVA